MEFTITASCSGSKEDFLGLVREAMNLPMYWHGMREINEEGKGSYSVRFQFPGKALMKYFCDEEKGICTETYVKGPFTGTKTTELVNAEGGSVLRTHWNIKLSLMLKPMRKTIEKHFTEGSQNALNRLCEASSARNETKQ